MVPSPTGASQRISSFIQAAATRYQVVVLSTKTPEHSHIERYHGSRLLRVPVGSGDLASRIQTFDRAVRRQVDSEDYAVACFADPFGGYPLCELRKNTGYRLIYDAASFPSVELKDQSPLLAGDRRFMAKLRRQELFCLMNSDRVLTGSEVTRRYVEQLGVASANIQVVRTPVELAAFAPPEGNSPDRSPMKVLYLGSELPWQGVPLLIRALEKALPRAPMSLTLAGPAHPDWHGPVEDLIDEKGLGQVVKLLPAVPHAQLPELLHAHDVCVAPLTDCDRNRLQGGAVAKISEALAAGRALVAADLPLTRELCPADATVFFKPDDAGALADRLVELSHHGRLRSALGASGRAYAARQLDPAKVGQTLLRLYDDLIGTGPRAPNGAEPPAPTPTLKLARRPLRPNLPGAGSPTPALTPTGAAPPAHIFAPEAEATPSLVPPELPAEEAPALADDDVLSADDVAEPVEAADDLAGEDLYGAAPSARDPWLAQLLFGYCPPEAHLPRHPVKR